MEREEKGISWMSPLPLCGVEASLPRLLLLQGLKRMLREVQDSHTGKVEASERDWIRRAQEVELHWEKRLRDG